jgi:hypothetical protein
LTLTDQGKVYVDPLVEEIVSTPQDVVDLLEKGNTQRKTGATDWVRLLQPILRHADVQNERSSRSHSVFTIVIESKPRDGNSDDDVRLSRLTLIVSLSRLFDHELICRIWLVLRRPCQISSEGERASTSTEGTSLLPVCGNC